MQKIYPCKLIYPCFISVCVSVYLGKVKMVWKKIFCVFVCVEKEVGKGRSRDNDIIGEGWSSVSVQSTRKCKRITSATACKTFSA